MTMAENTKSSQNRRSAAEGALFPDALTGKSVLLIEDEYLVGLDMAQTIETWGMIVSGPIQTLNEAEEAAEAEEWDCAVLDVRLDKGETFDIARKLRKRGVMVVFVTAYSGDPSHFASDLASIPRLGKPVPYATLRRLLLEAMRDS